MFSIVLKFITYLYIIRRINFLRRDISIEIFNYKMRRDKTRHKIVTIESRALSRKYYF